ncbi:alpha-L-fucosidase [Clostridiaceae bacterium M8S5]|nr:alpha-L-fucosidase [Clostridiaceae bacterium M8S5]
MLNYQASYKSVSTHKIPKWYEDAKFGIFIHWGLYSIPAWAEPGDINEKIKNHGHGPHFYHNSYAEWYKNTYQLEGSKAKEYHMNTFGKHFDYNDFQKDFEKKGSFMDPKTWAKIFKEIGAQYVVLVAKHHDGYCLWPTKQTNPVTSNFYSKKDYVGEITEAIRAEGMKIGVYYSGVIDWSVRNYPSKNTYTLAKNFQHNAKYIKYATNQYKELIDTYKPSILWNDIGYPCGYDLNKLFSYYYNNVPNGVINDRWEQDYVPMNPLLQPLVKLVCWNIDRKTKQIEFNVSDKEKFWFDYKTPEYSQYEEKTCFKWEMIRGVGDSFGYNQNETIDNMMEARELIHLLIDVVSKNGNLLINVGPRADGSIPDIQLEPLKEMGKWLTVNGDAIYGTRTFERATGTTADGKPVRFTQKNDAVYAIILGSLDNTLIIEGLESHFIKSVTVLNGSKVKRWANDGKRVIINLEVSEQSIYANAIKFELDTKCSGRDV